MNDRFIPNRANWNSEASSHIFFKRSVTKKAENEMTASSNSLNRASSNYHNIASSNNLNLPEIRALQSSISSASTSEVDCQVDNIKRKLIIESCNGIQEKAKILPLHSKPMDSEQKFTESLKYYYNSGMLANTKKVTSRYIPSTPERILDAPEFRDDYCKILLKSFLK